MDSAKQLSQRRKFLKKITNKEIIYFNLLLLATGIKNGSKTTTFNLRKMGACDVPLNNPQNQSKKFQFLEVLLQILRKKTWIYTRLVPETNLNNREVNLQL